VKEAAAVELPPQAPQYQGSPLKVFGEHEDGNARADAQLHGRRQRRAGTICADGHLAMRSRSAV